MSTTVQFVIPSSSRDLVWLFEKATQERLFQAAAEGISIGVGSKRTPGSLMAQRRERLDFFCKFLEGATVTKGKQLAPGTQKSYVVTKPYVSQGDAKRLMPETEPLANGRAPIQSIRIEDSMGRVNVIAGGKQSSPSKPLVVQMLRWGTPELSPRTSQLVPGSATA